MYRLFFVSSYPKEVGAFLAHQLLEHVFVRTLKILLLNKLLKEDLSYKFSGEVLGMPSTEFEYKVPEKMYRKFPEKSKRLRDSIVQFIGPKMGETIVDVGTGAGFLAISLAEKVGKDGKVIGLDVSKSAIKQARLKATKENLCQTLEFRIGDVYSLP